MKIGIVGTEIVSAGKAALKDERVDALQKLFSSAKKVYVQLEVVGDPEKLNDTDCIICAEEARLDLIVHDMEFVEARLAKPLEAAEQGLLTRFKEALDKEQFIASLPLTDEERKAIAGYGLLTARPVVVAQAGASQDPQKLLDEAYRAAGGISFFTAGEKDAHAWPLRKGASAWDAAGCIHTDIQRGFIRAEVVSYQELVSAGGMNQVKAQNLLRLENKEYVVQDGDYMLFRFNK